MITRDIGDGGWQAACAGTPPPLHAHRHDNPAACWYPLPRIVLAPQPPGPVMIRIPVVAPFGDDPTDPAAQTVPRFGTSGMIGWLNPRKGPRTVHPAGVRA